MLDSRLDGSGALAARRTALGEQVCHALGIDVREALHRLIEQKEPVH
jgi:hypothetical protein